MVPVAVHEMQRPFPVAENRVWQFLGRLCVSISLTILLFVTCEVMCFFVFRFYSRNHGSRLSSNSVYQGQPWAGQMWTETNAADVLEYHSYTSWRKRPFKGTLVNIDSEGIRSTEFNGCQPKATVIWVFGSSSLWGTGAPDSKTIPSLLAQHYKDEDIAACVVNFGEEAWVSTQEVVQLMLRLKHASRTPDIVVFYDGATDGFTPYQTSRYDEHANFDKIKQQFDSATAPKGGFQYLKQTNMVQLIEAILTQLETAKAIQEHKQELIADADQMAGRTVQRYLENARLVEALSVEYKFRPVFFWQPLICVGKKPLSSEEERTYASLLRSSPGLEEIYRRTYQLMRARGRPEIIDMEDVFDQTPEDVYLDSAHLAPRGNEIIADRIFSALKHVQAMTSPSALEPSADGSLKRMPEWR
jgi:hypothetical protein